MHWLVGIFALLTGAAGWFYLFYSRAAHRLGVVENERLNQRRIALRRMGGIVMLLLGGFFFAGFAAFDEPEQAPRAFAAVWITVFVLLVVMILLAMMDLRLTYQLRNRQKGSPPS
jgi:hypothetical protein